MSTSPLRRKHPLYLGPRQPDELSTPRPFGVGTRVQAIRTIAPMAGFPGATAFWLEDRPTSRIAYFGAPQTIELMAKAALEDAEHFETRRLAEIICEGLDSKDYVSEYLAGYHFLLQHTRYMRDPRRTELVRAPWKISQAILQGRRPSIDCDDAADWLAAYTLAIGGVPCFATVAFALQKFKDEIQYSHVLTCATEPRTGTRILLDPVAAEKTSQMLARVKAARVWPIAA